MSSPLASRSHLAVIAAAVTFLAAWGEANSPSTSAPRAQQPIQASVAAAGAHSGLIDTAASCEPSWVSTFGGRPGANAGVFALCVLDAGNGPKLYAAGEFSTIGGVPANRIAVWNGLLWSALGAEPDGDIHALAVFDDGGGPALYAGGEFTRFGEVQTSRIAKWDGQAWSPVGGGMDGTVRTLAVFDHGPGPALYAGGDFLHAGGALAWYAARWNGASWSKLGGGPNGVVHALATHDDGSGPALYAGGEFTIAGSAWVRRIAKWNGTSWSALGSGVGAAVHAIASLDESGGPVLYAGGIFTTAGGVSAPSIARWDGVDWSSVGGTDGQVLSLQVYDDGGGQALFVAGEFGAAGGIAADNIAKWDGASWSPLGSGIDPLLWQQQVLTMATADLGSGAQLYVGGTFGWAGGMNAGRIASWDGSSWSVMPPGLDSTIEALLVVEEVNGPALYAGGYVRNAGGERVNGIGRWDGSSWAPLHNGVHGGNVRCLTVFDDGGGPALYAGGQFTFAGPVSANNIAKWDGSAWSALGAWPNGPGVDGRVFAALSFDDGQGPALFVGGSFTQAGTTPSSRIARWDGTSWSALGSGTNGIVHALAAFDDGSGEALYAGGSFTSAGTAVQRIARWDGSAWSAVGALNDTVWALAVFDDGSGPALYAGGGFTLADGVPANHIARWDGASWSPLGSGLEGEPWTAVYALEVFDDGSGPALYVGGSFQLAGGATAMSLARWDGTSWSSLESGIERSVFALAAGDVGDGPFLYAGGDFSFSASGDSRLARWSGCAPAVGAAFCFGDETACPCGNAGAPDEGCANSTGAGARASATGSASASADDLSIDATNLPLNAPALLFGAADVLGGGSGTPFGDGLRCAAGSERRLDVRFASSGGSAKWGPGIAGQAGYAAGQTARFQVWYRDVAGSPCGAGFNLSNGLEVTFGG